MKSVKAQKSATLPRVEDKRIVRDALTSSNIFIAAVARLYIAHNHSWKYSGLWGAVAFCKDRNKNNSHFIRLIDMEDGKGVIWEQELYQGFEYHKDCAYFHTFETDDCLAGILFVHQGEADLFYEKLTSREAKQKKSHNDVGRVSYVPGKGFTIDNNDPEILAILKELEKLDDFSAADINQNQDFIQSFIQQYRNNKKDQPAPPTTSRRAPPPPPPPSRKTTRNNMPPPPIPPMKNKSPTGPPPPPLPNRGLRQTPSMSSFNQPLPPPPPMMNAPPPPPPPMMNAPPPPPPPMMNASRPPPPMMAAPRPPLPMMNVPPPPPPMMNAPPPPPPPPMMGTPPPPPPPGNYASSPASSPIPAAASTDGRVDLMAAIRSTGGFGSLKKGGTLKSVPSPRSQSTVSNSSNKNESIQSSLAAVLQQRKTAMQSDDEDDDDDDDWK